MTLVILLMVIITLFGPDIQPLIYSKGGRSENYNNNVIPMYAKGLTTKEEFGTFHLYRDFDFCQSEETASSNGSLQDGLYGPRTPYLIRFLENRPCTVLCTKSYNGENSSRQKLDYLKRAISLNYEHRWFVDNLPVKWCYSVGDGERRCRNSFPVGCHVTNDKNTCSPVLKNPKNDTYYLFNHVDLEFIYHSEENEKGDAGANEGRILFVKVTPASINHGTQVFSFRSRNCEPLNNPQELPTSMDDADNFLITYTYSVNFLKNNTIKYPSKWARTIGPILD